MLIMIQVRQSGLEWVRENKKGYHVRFYLLDRKGWSRAMARLNQFLDKLWVRYPLSIPGNGDPVLGELYPRS